MIHREKQKQTAKKQTQAERAYSSKSNVMNESLNSLMGSARSAVEEVNEVCSVSDTKLWSWRERRKEKGGRRGGGGACGCVRVRMWTVSAVYTQLLLTGSAAAPRRRIRESRCVVVFFFIGQRKIMLLFCKEPFAN